MTSDFALCVIDPGLMSAAGHHASLFETIVAWPNVEDIAIYSHNCLDDDFSSKAGSRGLRLERWFDTNFYENYNDGDVCGHHQCLPWIRKLAIEYRAAITDHVSKTDYTKSVFLYPTMNWEHVSALSLALEGVDGDCKQSSHFVFCMFTPEKHDVLRSQLYCSLSYRYLNDLKDVHLYASDEETRLFLNDINVHVDGIHPCYLLPWRQIAPVEDVRGQTLKVLLYSGDAKKSKGFDKLPVLVSDLARRYPDVEFIIHYTDCWSDSLICGVISKIESARNLYANITVISKFLSSSEIAALYSSVDCLVCTHDVESYQTKSSGLAWLASFFNLNVWVEGDFWISREIYRLGGVVNYGLPTVVNDFVKGGDEFLKTAYNDEIYCDLKAWLATQFQKVSLSA